MTRHGVDNVTVGGVEFTVTKDSFKLNENELDYESIQRPCQVCDKGLECDLRFKAR